MSIERHAFRPQLEALEDRCQPSVSLRGPIFSPPSVTQHTNTLPVFIYNPFDVSGENISSTTSHHSQSSGTIFNPFSPYSSSGSGGSSVTFNPFK